MKEKSCIEHIQKGSIGTLKNIFQREAKRIERYATRPWYVIVNKFTTK